MNPLQDESVNSPIQEVHLDLFEARGLKLFCKRDDLIDPVISGNKWRKLSLNLEAARAKEFQRLVTFGGPWSNHIAAVAEAGKRFDFETFGLIRGEDGTSSDTLVAARDNGMKVYFIDRESYRQKLEAASVRAVLKEIGPAYVIPEGGANSLGSLGCRSIVSEIDIEFDVICCPVGTGTTLAGIASGLQPTQKVLGFSALKGMKESGLFGFGTDEFLGDRIELITDYHFGGYARISKELIDFIRSFYAETRIPLDAIYTGKMMFGLMDMVERDYFKKGTQIVAIHTGGLQGNRGIEARYGVTRLP